MNTIRTCPYAINLEILENGTNLAKINISGYPFHILKQGFPVLLLSINVDRIPNINKGLITIRVRIRIWLWFKPTTFQYQGKHSSSQPMWVVMKKLNTIYIITYSEHNTSFNLIFSYAFIGHIHLCRRHSQVP